MPNFPSEEKIIMSRGLNLYIGRREFAIKHDVRPSELNRRIDDALKEAKNELPRELRNSVDWRAVRSELAAKINDGVEMVSLKKLVRKHQTKTTDRNVTIHGARHIGSEQEVKNIKLSGTKEDVSYGNLLASTDEKAKRVVYDDSGRHSTEETKWPLFKLVVDGDDK